MESESARLEREAEEARWQLSGTLEELRGRITPGRVVDQVIDYTRDSPATDFFRNLAREVRENPMPLVLIGIGIAWLLAASSRTSRAAIANAADNLSATAVEIGDVTGAALRRAGEWRERSAERIADRASGIVSTVGDKAAQLVGQSRRRTPDLGETARLAAIITGSAVEQRQWPVTDAAQPGSPDDPLIVVSGDRDAARQRDAERRDRVAHPLHERE